MLVKCTHKKYINENSWARFVQHFYCSDKNEINIHVWGMKYELCAFGDFDLELNLIASNLVHNGKIHADN